MITATLVGAQTPPLVQVVVSATVASEPWTLTGATDDWSWLVASGVGDGGQLVAADIRAPGNRPVVYTLQSETLTEASDPVTVPMTGSIAFQSTDGQRSVEMKLMVGSLGRALEPSFATFKIPGRDLPVVRYSRTGKGGGELRVRVPRESADLFEDLLSGGPFLYRFGGDSLDLPPVAMILPTAAEGVATLPLGFRDWVVPFLFVPDPVNDLRLGAFSWNVFDDVWDGRDWDEFDAIMSGLSWDQFDTFDWATLA